MHNGHVAGAEHPVDGRFLCRIEPWEAHRIKLSKRWLPDAYKYVAKFGQAVAFGTQGIFQSLKHGAVARFVEKELDTQIDRVLHLENGAGTRHYDDHAAFVGVAYRALHLQVSDASVGRLAEEADRTPVLEVVFDVRVLRAGKFHCQLVERVVVAPSGCYGIPAHASFHLAGHLHRLGLTLEFLLFVFVLHAQQPLLLLQV